jgi:hypothetical protein
MDLHGVATWSGTRSQSRTRTETRRPYHHAGQRKSIRLGPSSFNSNADLTLGAIRHPLPTPAQRTPCSRTAKRQTARTGSSPQSAVAARPGPDRTARSESTHSRPRNASHLPGHRRSPVPRVPTQLPSPSTIPPTTGITTSPRARTPTLRSCSPGTESHRNGLVTQ